MIEQMDFKSLKDIFIWGSPELKKELSTKSMYIFMYVVLSIYKHHRLY